MCVAVQISLTLSTFSGKDRPGKYGPESVQLVLNSCVPRTSAMPAVWKFTVRFTEVHHGYSSKTEIHELTFRKSVNSTVLLTFRAAAEVRGATID